MDRYHFLKENQFQKLKRTFAKYVQLRQFELARAVLHQITESDRYHILQSYLEKVDESIEVKNFCLSELPSWKKREYDLRLFEFYLIIKNLFKNNVLAKKEVEILSKFFMGYLKNMKIDTTKTIIFCSIFEKKKKKSQTSENKDDIYESDQSDDEDEEEFSSQSALSLEKIFPILKKIFKRDMTVAHYLCELLISISYFKLDFYNFYMDFVINDISRNDVKKMVTVLNYMEIENEKEITPEIVTKILKVLMIICEEKAEKYFPIFKSKYLIKKYAGIILKKKDFSYYTNFHLIKKEHFLDYFLSKILRLIEFKKISKIPKIFERNPEFSKLKNFILLLVFDKFKENNLKLLEQLFKILFVKRKDDKSSSEKPFKDDKSIVKENVKENLHYKRKSLYEQVKTLNFYLEFSEWLSQKIIIFGKELNGLPLIYKNNFTQFEIKRIIFNKLHEKKSIIYIILPFVNLFSANELYDILRGEKDRDIKILKSFYSLSNFIKNNVVLSLKDVFVDINGDNNYDYLIGLLENLYSCVYIKKKNKKFKFNRNGEIIEKLLNIINESTNYIKESEISLTKCQINRLSMLTKRVIDIGFKYNLIKEFKKKKNIINLLVSHASNFLNISLRMNNYSLSREINEHYKLKQKNLIDMEECFLKRNGEYKTDDFVYFFDLSFCTACEDDKKRVLLKKSKDLVLKEYSNRRLLIQKFYRKVEESDYALEVERNGDLEKLKSEFDFISKIVSFSTFGNLDFNVIEKILLGKKVTNNDVDTVKVNVNDGDGEDDDGEDGIIEEGEEGDDENDDNINEKKEEEESFVFEDMKDYSFLKNFLLHLKKNSKLLNEKNILQEGIKKNIFKLVFTEENFLKAKELCAINQLNLLKIIWKSLIRERKSVSDNNNNDKNDIINVSDHDKNDTLEKSSSLETYSLNLKTFKFVFEQNNIIGILLYILLRKNENSDILSFIFDNTKSNIVLSNWLKYLFLDNNDPNNGPNNDPNTVNDSNNDSNGTKTEPSLVLNKEKYYINLINQYINKEEYFKALEIGNKIHNSEYKDLIISKIISSSPKLIIKYIYQVTSKKILIDIIWKYYQNINDINKIIELFQIAVNCTERGTNDNFKSSIKLKEFLIYKEILALLKFSSWKELKLKLDSNDIEQKKEIIFQLNKLNKFELSKKLLKFFSPSNSSSSSGSGGSNKELYIKIEMDYILSKLNGISVNYTKLLHILVSYKFSDSLEICKSLLENKNLENKNEKKIFLCNFIITALRDKLSIEEKSLYQRKLMGFKIFIIINNKSNMKNTKRKINYQNKFKHLLDFPHLIFENLIMLKEIDIIKKILLQININDLFDNPNDLFLNYALKALEINRQKSSIMIPGTPALMNISSPKKKNKYIKSQTIHIKRTKTPHKRRVMRNDSSNNSNKKSRSFGNENELYNDMASPVTPTATLSDSFGMFYLNGNEKEDKVIRGQFYFDNTPDLVLAKSLFDMVTEKRKIAHVLLSYVSKLKFNVYKNSIFKAQSSLSLSSSSSSTTSGGGGGGGNERKMRKGMSTSSLSDINDSPYNSTSVYNNDSNRSRRRSGSSRTISVMKRDGSSSGSGSGSGNTSIFKLKLIDNQTHIDLKLIELIEKLLQYSKFCLLKDTSDAHEEFLEYERITSKFLILKLLLYNNCLKYSITISDLLNQNKLRQIRDQLVKINFIKLALKISKMSSLETTSVYIEWGIMLLKLNKFKEARLKFNECFKWSSSSRTHQFSLSKEKILKDILMILQNKFVIFYSRKNIFKNVKLSIKEEASYYLAKYGNENLFVSFFLKLNDSSTIIDYIVESNPNISQNIYLTKILPHLYNYGELNKFKQKVLEKYSSNNSTEEDEKKKKRFFILVCSFLQTKGAFHLLYEFQCLMKDEMRCGLTCIRIYLNEKGRRLSLLERAKKHFYKAIDNKNFRSSKNIKINRYLRTINLQMQIGKLNIPSNYKIKYDRSLTLFQSKKHKRMIVEQLIPINHGLAFKIMNDYTLNPMKLYKNSIKKFLNYNKNNWKDVNDLLNMIFSNNIALNERDKDNLIFFVIKLYVEEEKKIKIAEKFIKKIKNN